MKITMRRERERERERDRERERERERCSTYRCTERSEVKDKRQKLMKIFWGERELTNILNKKILKYHFLSCICIYIKFQKMFHSSDHEKRERERERERERDAVHPDVQRDQK